ncbi:hypothetical protein NQ314_009950 [Rhamnusium bicolor]|uniref:Uncharacterized protein n=1 Tax=Rhamnusium bicolor TaxID=1586634 RepID=A0AAV8XUI4_9CUCU|nr:hypothetical protein NQ314_009950 [Rhamnusium bicolor]
MVSGKIEESKSDHNIEEDEEKEMHQIKEQEKSNDSSKAPSAKSEDDPYEQDILPTVKPKDVQRKQDIPGSHRKSNVNKKRESNKKKDIKEKHIKGQKGAKDEEYSEDYSSPSEDSSSSTPTKKNHKSFRVLDEEETKVLDSTKPKKSKTKRSARKGSRSAENKMKNISREQSRIKQSKIPTPLMKTTFSKSDRHLDKTHKPEKRSQSTLDARIPSLPNIHEGKGQLKEPPRSESNMSAPILNSVYSDHERDSISDMEADPKRLARSRKRVKKRSKTREARSAGSDYESSNLIDSGFEPSPRSTRIPKWKNMSERGVNMTSVTQSIQTNIRR